MKKIFLTTSPWQTKKLGETLSKEVLKTESQKRALVINLEGDLGGGKTTFLQGLAKGLGIKERITSPTFVIIKRFKMPNCPIVQLSNFYHLDCYRIKKPKEILDLGFKEIVSGPRNIVAIEWADRIKKVIPKGTIWVSFAFLGTNKRKIVIKFK